MLKWKISRSDAALIDSIADRAVVVSGHVFNAKDRRDLVMDITAAHLNGNPLDLQRLLDADNFNFVHDIGGIRQHINRETGRLDNCFVPRFSLRR